MNFKTVVIIPSRLGSVRLPKKPLAKINGKEMVLHVAENATKANIGDCVVAVCEDELYEVVTKNGFKAVMTNPDLASGTDRVYEALTKIDPNGYYEYIVNLQGDLPVFSPSLLKELIVLMEKGGLDIGTLVCETSNFQDAEKASHVKAILANIKEKEADALYFSRSKVPYGAEIFHHHIGIYGFCKNALHKFVKLPQSRLELLEKLEQLRALEAGMKIRARIVNEYPVSVDTSEDLEKVRSLFK